MLLREVLKANQNRITDVPAPAQTGHVAEYTWTLGQIKAEVEARNPKNSARMASTGNLVLSGVQTVDTISGVAGDRVLVKNQTAPAENGLYDMKAAAWTRCADQDTNGEYRTGDYVFVQSGTQGGTFWAVSTAGTITVGTTPVAWVRVGAGQSYTAGPGLTLTGSEFAAGQGVGIKVAAGTISVDTDVVGRRFRGTITGNGSQSAFPVTHNLNNEDAALFLVDRASGDQVAPRISDRTPNGFTINLAPVPANNEVFGFTVIG